MNAHLKEAFSSIKPICDMVMVNPSPEHITAFTALVGDLKVEILQELQQYMLFPFITHLQSKEIETKYEMQKLLIDSMKEVLQRVTVTSLEMCIKIEMGLLTLVFEKPKPGMIADVPEELKLSVMQCLTVLMLHIDEPIRIKMLENQVPLLAQAVFVSVHLAKLEKLRALRLAALSCLLAHTGCHPSLAASVALQSAARGLLACILPGVLAALQDVATAATRPGHAVVVAALNATHLVLCLTMHNDHVPAKTPITAEDFVAMLSDKAKPDNDVSEESIRDSRLDAILAARDYHSLAGFIRDHRYQLEPPKKEKKNAKSKKGRAHTTNNPKNLSVMEEFGSHEQSSPNTSQNTGKAPSEIPKRSSEWYAMASEKLAIVVKSLIPLVSHEHYKVRKELAVLCHRIVAECSTTMQPSLTMALDVLISLSNDDYKEVSEYCAAALKTQFENPDREALDGFCENFFTTLNCLPRILNNIDDNRKLSVLNLLSGYLSVLCDAGRPQRLSAALSAGDGFHRLCDALLAAADIRTDLSLTAHQEVPCEAQAAPWRRARHLSAACSSRLQRAVAALARAECAALLLDRLLELFHERRTCDLLFLINLLGSAPDSSPDLARRIIGVYISEDVWYQPLEVRSGEVPLTAEDTLDVSVYNPRSWTKDSVPDLFEGTIETRYTDISSTVPRVCPEPNSCITLGQAQKNLTMCCLLTEGVGLMARRLGEDFQPYLLKTLCPLLERAGSRYPALRVSGLVALQHAAAAGGLASAGDLVAANGDYYTSQVTRRLRKPWSVESALQILSVVMEYSDVTIADYLYGIVEDVLVQSCDQYYENNLLSYLQVFNTFINCIKKWFPIEESTTTEGNQTQYIDVLRDVIEFAHNKEEADRLLNTEESERETGRSVEEMYQEDLKRREEELLNYDAKVTQESVPPPRHICVTESILKRCVHFVSCESRDAALQSLEALTGGLALLRPHPDVLLPLVHVAWGPLPPRLRADASVARRALALVVVMAELAGDFIRDRASKDVLPRVCSSLREGARRSLLQDAGAAYRLSAAYALQQCALEALAALAARLELRGAALRETLDAAQLYLSAKQPKPLQMLAVKFFKAMLQYDYGGTWRHLRRLGNDSRRLDPPPGGLIDLRPLHGAPHHCTDALYDTNVKLIFYLHK